MTELVTKILEQLGWEPLSLIKKKHGSSPQITNQEFIAEILSTESIVQLSNKLNIGEQTANRIIAKHLVPIFGKRTGGGDNWKLVLLNSIKYKNCSSCNLLKAHSEFTIDNSKFDRLDIRCKQCKSNINANFYKENKDTYYKQYIQEHRQEYNARNAKRRALKLKATPVWVNLDEIKEFYNNCPKGYHVDHIYPLISDWVCGLHVIENLQYLTAEENMRKGNRNIGTVV